MSAELARAPVRRFILIGEAPAQDAKKGRLEFALAAASCKLPPTLASAHEIGRTRPMLVHFWSRTDYVNLLSVWPGKSPGGRGSAFPFREARRAALDHPLAQVAAIKNYEVVLLCGTRVATAYGFNGVKFYEQLAACPRTYCVPHPSGASSHWNDPLARRDCRNFLQRLVDPAFVGEVA